MVDVAQGGERHQYLGLGAHNKLLYTEKPPDTQNMKMADIPFTFPDINAFRVFLKNPEVMGWPIALMGRRANEIVRLSEHPWWEHVEQIANIAIDLEIWAAAQACALVFQTYDGIVHNLKLSWIIENGAGVQSSDLHININGIDFQIDAPSVIELASVAFENMKSIDHLEAIHFLHETANTTYDASHLLYVARLREAFSKPMSSAMDAITIAQSVEPRTLAQMLAATNQMLLEQQTALAAIGATERGRL
jgi:hypothetical protein